MEHEENRDKLVRLSKHGYELLKHKNLEQARACFTEMLTLG
ncbi:MAG: hypothetical protein P8107_11415 [Spirochaetia bacterium]